MEIPMRAVLGRRTFLFEGMALATLTACRGEPQDPPEREGEAVRGASADTLMTGSGDAAAVLARSLEIAEAANALDLDRLMSYMHPDITYLVPSRVPIVGWDDVRAYYAGIHERFREQGQHFHLTSVPHRVVAIGEWAWKWGETHAVRTPLDQEPSLDPQSTPGSKSLSIYKREDGQWLRYVQMRNGNTPETNI